MMAILTLLTSRSWLVLRLSTGWGGRGRDIVSKRAENSILDTSTLFSYALICLTQIKLQIFGLLFGTVPTWNPFCVWGVLVFASWEHLACSWLLLVVDCGSWLLADIFWHHLLSTGWFFSIGCWWCLLLTTSCSQFTRWSDDLTDGSLVLSHTEVDQSHLADYAEH